MNVYALFDNATSENIRLKYWQFESETSKHINVHFLSSENIDNSVKASIETGIIVTNNELFSEELNKYIQKKTLNITPSTFAQKVFGTSAALPYAILHALSLAQKGMINCPVLHWQKISATGVIDNNGNIIGIKSIKQKIIAAIKENIDIIFFPSENLQELLEVRKEDSEFDKLISESNLILRHATTIRQILCEFGIFEPLKIGISNISINNKSIKFCLDIINSSKLELISAEFLLTGLKNVEGAIILAYNNAFKINVQNDNLHITFNSLLNEKNLLKESVIKIEIQVEINSEMSKSRPTLCLIKEKSYINQICCADMAGIYFSEIEKEIQKNNSEPIDITSIIQFLSSNKLKLFALAMFCFASIYLFKYVTSHYIEIPNNTSHIQNTPSKTSETSYRTTKNTAQLNSSTTMPTHTSLALQKPSSKSEVTNNLNITNHYTFTPKPTKIIPSLKPKQTIPQMALKTPLIPMKLEQLSSQAYWESKTNGTNSIKIIEEDDKAIRIDYSIKGNGYVIVKTKPGVFRSLPNSYSFISFYYRQITIESKKCTCKMKIYNNNVKSYSLENTEDMSKENKWVMKTIQSIDTNEISSIEFFIGTLGVENQEITKGSLLFRDFYVSP